MLVRFYLTLSGWSPVEDFINEQSQELKHKLADLIIMLEAGDKIYFPISRNMSSVYLGLHELRIRDRRGNYRFFYFLKKGEAIYMLHAFQKKTQKTPRKELDIVIKRIKEI